MRISAAWQLLRLSHANLNEFNPEIHLSAQLSFVFQADKSSLDDVITPKDSSAALKPERDIADEAFEWVDDANTSMGVGKNTTSKPVDSGSEGGKYEDDNKHGADFYPIPVHECTFIVFLIGKEKEQHTWGCAWNDLAENHNVQPYGYLFLIHLS